MEETQHYLQIILYSVVDFLEQGFKFLFAVFEQDSPFYYLVFQIAVEVGVPEYWSEHR